MIDKDALWQAYLQTPTTQNRNAVAEAYLYLAQAVARRFAGRGVETQDLTQVASLALLHAIERYDAGKGLKFTTFAVPTIAGEVRNYLRDKGNLVRLPRSASELLLRVHKARETHFRETGREPSVQELSEQLGVSADAILSALEMRSNAIPVSLDATLDDDGPTLADQLGAEETEFGRLEGEDAVDSLLRALPEPLPTVLKARYFENKNQREIAAALGVSQMQVSRLERRAIALLREKREEIL